MGIVLSNRNGTEARHLLATLGLALACVLGPAAAQPPTVGPAPTLARPEASAAPGGAPVFAETPRLSGPRFVSRGVPVLLSWANGLIDPRDLDAYLAVGLNTVYLDLDGRPEHDQAAYLLAQAAAKRGVPVIVGLNGLQAVVGDGAFAPTSRDTLSQIELWLGRTVAEWRDLPNIVAYALQSDLEERLSWGEPAFTSWLGAQYGTDLNRTAAWGFELPDGVAPSLKLIGELDGRKPGGFGRPTLDVARWRISTLVGLQRGWERAIHVIDPARPVLGGRMSRGRTLLCAPSELAGLQPQMLPETAGFAQADPFELAALASQSGRFAACVGLDSTAPPARLRAWARRAAAGGIAALCFSSWRALTGSDAAWQSVRAALVELDQVGAAAFVPRAGAAVVLQPYCSGPSTYGVQWYGYTPLGGPEPAGLLAMLRNGTAYGALDVLTPRDLAPLTGDAAAAKSYRVDLARYGCVFLPANLFLDDAPVDRLCSYVEDGGILVADFGLGSDGFAGLTPRMSPKLSRLFGVRPKRVATVMDVALTPSLRDRLLHSEPGDILFPGMPTSMPSPGAIVIQQETPLLPDVRMYDSTSPVIARDLLALPAEFVIPDEDTHVIGLQCQIPARSPLEAPGAGLFQKNTGNGTTVFASTLLWAALTPTDPFYAIFHDDLLRWRPALRVARDVGGRVGSTWVGRGRNSLWLERRSNEDGPLAIDLPDWTGQIYRGGLNIVRRANVQGVPGAEPLVNRRLTTLRAGEVRQEATLPMTLWPLGKSAAIDVSRYDQDRVELTLYGPGTDATVDPLGRWQIESPTAATFLLTLHDGAYRLPPGSLHRVELRRWLSTPARMPDLGRGSGTSYGTPGIAQSRTDWRTLTADLDGNLVLRDEAQVLRVRILPVDSPPAARAQGADGE